MPPTIELEYKNDLPAWRIRAVQPGRFKGVSYALQARLFCLPQGALVAVLLKLYDVPEQPYFVHRVMDLTDTEVRRHVHACIQAGRILAIFDSVGQLEGFERALEIDRAQWSRCLTQGTAYNERIEADGEAALDSFLKVFRPVSQERGVEAAWTEVERQHALKPPQA